MTSSPAVHCTLTMIVTVYDMKKKSPLNSDDRYWSNIDLDNLYKVFVERKVRIFITEKQKADITNSCVVDDQENLQIFFLILRNFLR
jgi:hypothetical protein